MVIELDGEVHGFKRQKERDYLREKELEKLNLHIIRYTNFNILENLEDVIIDLKNICNKLKDEKRKLI